MTERLMYIIIIFDAIFFPICRAECCVVTRTGRWLGLCNGKVVETSEQQVIEILSALGHLEHGPTLLMPGEQIFLARLLQNHNYNLHGSVNYVYAVDDSSGPG